MIEVELCDAEGVFVRTVFIPPFVKPVEVIVFDHRLYYRDPLASPRNLKWREVFGVFGSTRSGKDYLLDGHLRLERGNAVRKFSSSVTCRQAGPS